MLISWIIAGGHITNFMEIPFAVQWGFSGLAIITAFILPESPTYLITKNKRSAAEKAYIRLHGSKADVAAGLNIIQSTIDHERAMAASAETATCRLFQRHKCSQDLDHHLDHNYATFPGCLATFKRQLFPDNGRNVSDQVPTSLSNRHRASDRLHLYLVVHHVLVG